MAAHLCAPIYRGRAPHGARGLKRLVLPTKFETIEVQPYPYYFGYATLVYTVAQPNEQMAAGFDRIMQEDNT